jgi:hypothetical protein
MMHSSLHFAAGVWLGILLFLPTVYKKLKANKRVADTIGLLILSSYALGLLAIAPSFLRQMGYPEEVCASPLMNIFLLHPLFDKIFSGGMLKGEIAMILAFVAQYLLILWAIKKTRKT